MACHTNSSLTALACALLAAACASVQGVRSQPLDAGDVRFYAAPFGDVVAATRAGALETLGIILGGGLVGAAVGSASPSWKPRYP
jgi:hypothetical protein